ncbi:MAG TPA: hypothetical protein VGE41_06105, partial [Verrucomicrobiae bacterium]
MSAALLLLSLVFGETFSARADEFDGLRLKWRNMLTMGTNANSTDTNYAPWISAVSSVAQSKWASMNTNISRTYL